jgi:hypothetical protein
MPTLKGSLKGVVHQFKSGEKYIPNCSKTPRPNPDIMYTNMLHTQQGSSAIRLARPLQRLPLRVFRLLSISSAIRRIGSPLTRSRNHGRLRNRHPVVLHSYGPGDIAIWGNKGRGSVDLIGSSELDVTDVLDQGPCVLKAVNTCQVVCEGSFWIFFVSLVFFHCILILDVRELNLIEFQSFDDIRVEHSLAPHEV